jgi:hypothetical protein
MAAIKTAPRNSVMRMVFSSEELKPTAERAETAENTSGILGELCVLCGSTWHRFSRTPRQEN